MPLYSYCCCACDNEFDNFHSMASVPTAGHVATVSCPECGKNECYRIITVHSVIGGKDVEVSDYNDVHEGKPKWLRFKDGHRERYDPSKHGNRKGGEADARKGKSVSKKKCSCCKREKKGRE